MFAALTGEILEERVIPFVEYDIVVTENNHPEEGVSNPEYKGHSHHFPPFEVLDVRGQKGVSLL